MLRVAGELGQLAAHLLVAEVEDHDVVAAGQQRAAEGGDQAGPAVTRAAEDVDAPRLVQKVQRIPERDGVESFVFTPLVGRRLLLPLGVSRLV